MFRPDSVDIPSLEPLLRTERRQENDALGGLMRVITAGKREQKRCLAERLLLGLMVLGGLVSVAGLALGGLQIALNPQSIAVVQSAGPSPVALPRPTLPQIPVKRPNDIREPVVQVAVSRMDERIAEVSPKPSKRRSKTGANLAERKSETFKDDFRLRDSGRLAMLAYDETAASQLRTKPGLAPELVQRGLLFSLPVHTAVAIIEQHDDFLKVQSRSGDLEDKVGWVRGDQIEGMSACKPGIASYCKGW